jgi:class I fructose-bisphosphate aldolase
MSLGKAVRLGRLFAHPSGRLCSIAADHFINYARGTLPAGLRDMAATLARIVAGKPDAVTLQRGAAASAWGPHAGKVPLILQSSILQLDDAFHEIIADPEDAVRLGADAYAVVAFLRGKTEAHYMKTVATSVREAARYEMPVVVHAYPRKFDREVSVSYAPEDIAWAVRCAWECGADVVKVPYPNDVAAYREIVSQCPVPIVAAGGPQTGTLEEALAMIRDVVRSGARGATVGRNVWGFERTTEAVVALRAVIHDGAEPPEALRRAGLR